mgnify:CR=1 FL=1
MTHLISIGTGRGIQIPSHLIQAAHLDDASDLFFEVTDQGLLIKPAIDAKAFDYDPAEDDLIWSTTDEQELTWPGM